MANSPDPVTAGLASGMEIDPPPATPLPDPMHHCKQNCEHPHQPLHQVDVNGQALPPPTSRSSPSLLTSNVLRESLGNPLLPPPAVQPIEPVREARRTREFLTCSPVDHRPKEQDYPRTPHEVQLEAVERPQTQISQEEISFLIMHIHRLETEAKRVDDAVRRLRQEMKGFGEFVKASRGTQGRAPAARPTGQGFAPELMAQQIAVISAKTNDMDAMKFMIESMEGKIRRLEATAVVPPVQANARAYAYPREPVPLSLLSTYTAPSYRPMPSKATIPPHGSRPIAALQEPQPYDPYSQSYGQPVLAMPESSQTLKPRPTPRGWMPFNPGVKWALSIGPDNPQELTEPALESLKRPKLGPIEPRVAYTTLSSSQSYEHMDTSDSHAARAPTYRRTFPSQTQSIISVPEATLPSQRSHSGLIAYGTPSDGSWRPESQHIAQICAPRGQSGRDGCVYKSMAAQVHSAGTPEWERIGWQGVLESQVGPNGYGAVAGTNMPVICRGSGGGGSQGGRPSSSGVNLGLAGVTAGVGIVPTNTSTHTKKTRSKPTRNANGLLFRPDGRVDRRSSAANLLKVSLRKKDFESRKPPKRKPTPSQQYSLSGNPDISSPMRGNSFDQDTAASVRKKHNNIMSRMFPSSSARPLDIKQEQL